jgi:hypothetical protein
MLTHSPITNVIIVLAIALGVIVVVDMVVLPIIQVEASCHLNPHGKLVGACFINKTR